MKSELILAVLLCSGWLTACGGGSSGSPAAPNPTEQPAQPTPTPTPTPTPEPTPEPSPAPTAAPVTHLAPYQASSEFHGVLDASKLQAPNSSTLIRQGDFNSPSAVNEYFYSTSDKPDELVFRVSGASQRAELRQMSEWYTGDAGNALAGHFYLANPLASTVDQLTVMQIHDSESLNKPLLRIVWMRDKNNLVDNLWAVIKDDTVPAGQYSWIALGPRNDQGDRVAIQVGHNLLSIEHNGEAIVANRNVDYWQALSSYFKAGVYLQSDGEGQVHFTELRYQRTGAPSAALPPSGNFNLDVWKLTLPYAKDEYFGSGGSSAAEIKPFQSNPSGLAALNDGFEDDAVFSTAPDGAMRFTVNLADPRLATTDNAHYARSELRELYQWSPGTSDSQANWTPPGQHQLNARVAVTSYYPADPQVVIGQIHAKDSAKALVKLQWDGPTAPVRAILNEHPVDGNPFSLTFSTPGSEPFDYQLSLSGDLLSITVAGQTQQLSFGSDALSSLWRAHSYYFKAGNYAQAPIGSTGQFVVDFYALSVRHRPE